MRTALERVIITISAIGRTASTAAVVQESVRSFCMSVGYDEGHDGKQIPLAEFEQAELIHAAEAGPSDSKDYKTSGQQQIAIDNVSAKLRF